MTPSPPRWNVVNSSVRNRRVSCRSGLASVRRLCDLRDRIEDERRRDGGGEADLQWRDLLALELLGSATHRLCRGQCALQHRKDFLPKVGELRQLALAVDQLAAELLLKLLHPLRQGGLRDIALLGCAGEVECGRDGEEVASLMKFHGVSP